MVEAFTGCADIQTFHSCTQKKAVLHVSHQLKASSSGEAADLLMPPKFYDL